VLSMRLTPQQEHEAVEKWWAEGGRSKTEAEVSR
jgi:hypothetical protein